MTKDEPINYLFGECRIQFRARRRTRKRQIKYPKLRRRFQRREGAIRGMMDKFAAGYIRPQILFGNGDDVRGSFSMRGLG